MVSTNACMGKFKNKIGYTMYAYLYDLSTTYVEAHESTIDILGHVTLDEDHAYTDMIV
jgi:hypothetical protein